MHSRARHDPQTAASGAKTVKKKSGPSDMKAASKPKPKTLPPMAGRPQPMPPVSTQPTFAPAPQPGQFAPPPQPTGGTNG